MASSRKWSNRRRPRPVSSTTTTSQDTAAQKIAVLSDIKTAYYSEKLAMQRRQHDAFMAEHDKRMKVLDVQEQLARRQLQGFEE